MNMINFDEKTPLYGDKFKTRNDDIATFIWISPDGKYLMQLNNSTFCWPVNANGRLTDEEDSTWDIIEQLETVPPPTWKQQLDEDSSIYKDAMTKLLDQVGDISKERRLDRREKIVIALINAWGKDYSILDLKGEVDRIESIILNLE